MTYIEELREVIRRLHGVESKHIASVPIKETFRGRTVWDGCVEIFELVGHPTAARLYAWSHDTKDPANPKRHVTVLHSDLITSPLLAVRAAIVQEFKSNATSRSLRRLGVQNCRRERRRVASFLFASTPTT
jgi:hypothetical protein